MTCMLRLCHVTVTSLVHSFRYDRIGLVAVALILLAESLVTFCHRTAAVAEVKSGRYCRQHE